MSAGVPMLVAFAGLAVLLAAGEYRIHLQESGGDALAAKRSAIGWSTAYAGSGLAEYLARGLI